MYELLEQHFNYYIFISSLVYCDIVTEMLLNAVVAVDYV